MSFLFLSGSPAKGSSNTGPDFKACRRAALIRRNSFFIRLEFYGIRGLRRERKKEARRIPVHYKDSVLSGINKVFGADSTEYGKNRAFRRIGRTERRERNGRQCGCTAGFAGGCSRLTSRTGNSNPPCTSCPMRRRTSPPPHTPPARASARIRGTDHRKDTGRRRRPHRQ